MMFLLGDFLILISFVLAKKTKRIGFGGVSFAKEDNPLAFYICLIIWMIAFVWGLFCALEDFGVV